MWHSPSVILFLASLVVGERSTTRIFRGGEKGSPARIVSGSKEGKGRGRRTSSIRETVSVAHVVDVGAVLELRSNEAISPNPRATEGTNAPSTT